MEQYQFLMGASSGQTRYWRKYRCDGKKRKKT